MALSDSNSKEIIKAEMIAIFGLPNSEAHLDNFCTALGKAVNRILKEDAVVNSAGTAVIASGSSAGSWPTTNTGTIV